tara:strand:+ start:296 stop:973 length:678 start_codon:yes stop_codon:yes gene_type:complete
MAIDTRNLKATVFNWGPCVMQTTVPKYITDKLIEEGRVSEYKGMKTSKRLAGHIKNQVEYSHEVQKWFYNEMLPVFQMYRYVHCQYHKLPNIPCTFEPQALWCNFQRSKEFNPHHIHIGDFSFVVYCQIPKELEKEREEFYGTAALPGEISWEFTQQARPRWATTGIGHQPKEGECFIFPAMLQHWVMPFYTENIERISVSGNVKNFYHPEKMNPPMAKLPENYF